VAKRVKRRRFLRLRLLFIQKVLEKFSFISKSKLLITCTLFMMLRKKLCIRNEECMDAVEEILALLRNVNRENKLLFLLFLPFFGREV